MNTKSILSVILASLILASTLVSCADTENSETTAGNTQDIALQTAVETDKATNAATDAVTDSQTTSAPETDKMTDAPETNAPVEDTEAPETKAPETDPPATKAPETQAPADTQPIADPERFPDDWGDSYEKNAIRTDYKYIVWTKTRHLVEVPESIGKNWVVEIVDANNEQMFISDGSLREGTCVFYALVNGVFYKLSEEKVVKVTINSKKFAWLEEDGTVYSINVRSKWFNEVYVEASGAAGIGFRNNELIVVNQDAEMIEKNREDILRDVKKVSD